MKSSGGAAEEAAVRSCWPGQGVWLGSSWWPLQTGSFSFFPPAPSTRGQQSAPELPSARRAASPRTRPLLRHAVLGKLSSLNSGHFTLRFFFLSFTWTNGSLDAVQIHL